MAQPEGTGAGAPPECLPVCSDGLARVPRRRNCGHGRRGPAPGCGRGGGLQNGSQACMRGRVKNGAPRRPSPPQTPNRPTCRRSACRKSFGRAEGVGLGLCARGGGGAGGRQPGLQTTRGHTGNTKHAIGGRGSAGRPSAGGPLRRLALRSRRWCWACRRASGARRGRPPARTFLN